MADRAVLTGVERVVGELLQVVRASARELDDLGHDVGIEPDRRGCEWLGDCPGRSLGIERPERDWLEEAHERLVGPMDGANRPGDAATPKENETSVS